MRNRLMRALRDPAKVRVYAKARLSSLYIRLRYLSPLRDSRSRLKIAPVVFLRTPKCASSSILAVLESADRVVNFIKSPDAELSEAVIARKVICISAASKEKFIERHPAIWARAFKWAVVRHPYERAVSAWRYMETLRNTPLEELLDHPPTREDAPQEFHHFTNPLSTMLSSSGELVVDEVIKFESLAEDLPWLFARLGVPYVGLAHVNQTPGSKPKVDALLSDAAKRKAQQLYALDFEAFGYEA